MITPSPLSLSQLPGPVGWPVLGNLLQLELPRLHQIFEQWSDEYGSIYSFKILNKPVIVISDTTLIQTILRERPDAYRRGGSIEAISRESGTHGVFSAEGEQWQLYRHFTTQAFKPEHLRQFFPVLSKITSRLHQRWMNGINSGQYIDIKNDLMRYAADVITNFAFGYDINLLTQTNNNFQNHLEKLLPIFNRRTDAPFPYWRYFKFPSDRAMERSLVVINKTINDFVQQTRYKLLQIDKKDYQARNFLETLLLAQDDTGHALSDEEIYGNILSLLLAGESTTAHALAWLVHLLVENPAVQLSIQQEVDMVLGTSFYPLNMETMDQLSYIDAVISETLRLKSVAPLLSVECNQDVELNGIHIPQGTLIMLLTRHGALQEENFTDAKMFKPDRWLNKKRAACSHNRQANLPFGVGPRFCPGRNLALLEIKMAIAMLCKNFSISRIANASNIQEVFSFTMMPSQLNVKFERR